MPLSGISIVPFNELSESDLYASHDAKSPVGFNPHSPHLDIWFKSFSLINKHLP